MFQFLDDKNISKLELNKAYVSKHENIVDIPEDRSVSLDNIVMLEKLVAKYLPELDFSVINAPIICETCREFLPICSRFMKNCLIVEENIQKYCQAEGINGESAIELTNVQEYTSRNMSRSEEDSKTLDGIREYKPFHADRESADHEVKNFNVSFMKAEEQKLNSAQLFLPKLEDTKYLVTEAIEIKTEQDDFDSLQDEDSSPQSEVGIQLRRCCGSLPEEYHLESYLCEIKRENDVEAKYKGAVHSHALGHQNHSEIKMHQCAACPFKTKYSKSLRRHMVRHKNSSELTMHQCESCSFKSKLKDNLRNHMLTHKNPSEITMYQCNYCSFQTKYKNHLAVHMWRHQDPSKTTTYQCESCDFKTKYKSALRKHNILIHMDPAEITMFQCESCDFKARTKSNLHTHMLIHKDPTEITTHQCESCPYKTNHKTSLFQHKLTHKDPSEVTMYQCVSCPHRTRRKSDLVTHTLIHKDLSEITMHQCYICSYKTKYKSYLNVHMLIHKHPSEVTMYKCLSCSFQTKRKRNLRSHMATFHSNPRIPSSETTMQ